MEEEKTPLLFEIDSYSEKDSSTNICLSETELSNSTEIKEAGFKIDWSEEKHDEIKKANVGGTQVQGFKAAWKRVKARVDRDNKMMIADFKKMTDVQELKAAWERAKARNDRDNKMFIANFKKMTDVQELKAAWERVKARNDRDNKMFIANFKKMTDVQELKAAWKRVKAWNDRDNKMLIANFKKMTKTARDLLEGVGHSLKARFGKAKIDQTKYMLSHSFLD